MVFIAAPIFNNESSITEEYNLKKGLSGHS